MKTGFWLLLGIALAIVFTQSIHILRYVKYLIFPALLAINIMQKRPVFRLYNVNKKFIIFTLLWLGACLVSLVIGVILNEQGDINYVRYIKEFYFTNTALFSTLLLFNISSTTSIKKGVNYFIVFSFIYIFIISYKSILALASYESSIFYFVTPPTENFLSSIYGAAFIMYLHENNKKLALLSFVSAIIGAKRIIIVAVLVTGVLFFVLKPFKKLILANKWTVSLMALFVNFAIAIAFYLVAQGAFDEIVFQLTGIPPNWLFSGRVAMYKDVFDYVGSIPWLPRGLGFIGTILEDKHIHSNVFFIHMHSDVLKYIIEFGVIMFALIFTFMYRMALQNYASFMIMIYFNIFMLTDNPSILYEFYIFYFIILMLMLRSDAPKNIPKVLPSQGLRQ